MNARPNGHQGQSEEVEAVVGTGALLDPRHHEHDGDRLDRNVEPEDPLPGQAFGDRAADEGPEERGQAGHALKMPSALPRNCGGTAALSWVSAN
jgi:hypothetical protein